MYTCYTAGDICIHGTQREILCILIAGHMTSDQSESAKSVH